MSNDAGPVVLFGGGGFLGRVLAQDLLKQGHSVRIAQRNPKQAYAIRLGRLGQVQFVSCDIDDADKVARVLDGASAAVNLVGILKGDMKATHVIGAGNVAEAAARVGVGALVHVSALGADPDSASAYGATKGEGEAAVRAAFPGATIMRPSLIFGQDDQFTNRFADMISTACSLPLVHVVPVVRGATRFQPVHVNDVARTIAMAATDPVRFGGQTYELGGPDILSMRVILEWLAQEIGRAPSFMPLPDPLAKLTAALTGWAPGAPITLDQFKMLLVDNVVSGANGFEAFGIRPAPMAAIAPAWLTRYRRHGRFAKPASA